MARPTAEVVAAFRRFRPTCNNWSGLATLLDELLESASATVAINEVLGIFERFPKEELAETFWYLARGIEKLPGYERELVESVRRTPSEFTLKLVHRLISAGRSEVDGVPLLSLLEEVACKQEVTAELRRSAEAFLSAQDG